MVLQSWNSSLYPLLAFMMGHSKASPRLRPSVPLPSRKTGATQRGADDHVPSLLITLAVLFRCDWPCAPVQYNAHDTGLTAPHTTNQRRARGPARTRGTSRSPRPILRTQQLGADTI